MNNKTEKAFSPTGCPIIWDKIWWLPDNYLTRVKYSWIKKTLVDSCQAPVRNCQHLNFCFLEHFYWLRTKELCWEARAVSFNFFFIFLTSRICIKYFYQCWQLLVGAWQESTNVFLNPYDFTWRNLAKRRLSYIGNICKICKKKDSSQLIISLTLHRSLVWLLEKTHVVNVHNQF